MGKGVIIALDFKSKEETIKFLDLFTDEKLFVKIGYEIFYAEELDQSLQKSFQPLRQKALPQ